MKVTQVVPGNVALSKMIGFEVINREQASEMLQALKGDKFGVCSFDKHAQIDMLNTIVILHDEIKRMNDTTKMCREQHQKIISLEATIRGYEKECDVERLRNSLEREIGVDDNTPLHPSLEGN